MYIKINLKDKMFFNQLYNDYQICFLNFVNIYVRDWDVVEDIIIEVLIYYWENRNILFEVFNIFVYIFIIIKNKSFNYFCYLQIWEEYFENIRKYIEWEFNVCIVFLDVCEFYEFLVKEM